MGKILDEYKKQYDREIKPGIKKGDSYVVIPEIWITYKFLEDSKIEPWKPEFEEFICKLEEEDPEMAATISKGITMVFLLNNKEK